MTGVQLVRLSKRFDETLIVNDFSLTMSDNEFVAFLGPSGCGKSTILRMIAGLETVDAGEVHIGGRRIDRLPPGERGVAMVFQHYALYPHMSVRENMAFGLKNVGVAAAEITSRIATAAEMLEITALLDRKPGVLSGGERQRTAIARAIVKQPKLFLFDEPMSNLDAALRLRTRLELAQLRQRVRAAMILVTHDQVEAMTLADRIVVLSRKGVEQIGAPMDIYDRPATTFVATFVGAPQINLVPAQAVSAQDGFAQIRIEPGIMMQTRVPATGLPSNSKFQIGLRPDAIRVGAVGEGDLDAIVDVVERLGDRTHVFARLPGGLRLVAENKGASTLRPGDIVSLTFNAAAAHLFDPQDRGHHAAA